MTVKGTKRSAQASAAAEPKKAKMDPMVAAVIDGLKQANISEESRALLVAMSPSCFVVHGGKGHESQVAVASWIQEVLEEEQARLQTGLDAIDKEVAIQMEKTEELRMEVGRGKTRLEAADTALTNGEAKVAEAQAAYGEAKDAFERDHASRSGQEESEQGDGVDAALTKINDLETQLKAASSKRQDAEVLQRQLATELGMAQAALDTAQGNQGALSETRQKKADVLQNFSGYHMECFNMLRSRLAPAGA